MTTDTTERGLERIICRELAGNSCDPPREGDVAEFPASYGGVGWACGNWQDYDPEYCVDLPQLAEFLRATQPQAAEALALKKENSTPTQRQFLARLHSQISKRGTIDVLRKGIKHQQHDIALFYPTPTAGNAEAARQFEANRFSVTRQLRYSRASKHSLDMALFINGLPVVTFELKNNLTKQTADDAVGQYKKDRSPREKLFEFGRCIAHFAVDDREVQFCTHLRGGESRFLPFNRGFNDGAGNPPNPNGIKTDYLWREILTRNSLAEIIENYAQVVERKEQTTGHAKKEQVWPRYHQIDVVRKLLADAGNSGVGKRYLIQHSAGSGKSNSIAWLAHQLIGLRKDDKLVFDSIIVVTDRILLDRQIDATIKQYMQVGATVGHADRSGDLRKFIEDGKKIIISTVQKFPHILKEIGDRHRGRRFAIIVDEAHSSQGGKTGAAIAGALAESGAKGEDETFEDQINRAMESRKLLRNASYFAFTATPKNKTLEIFGDARPQPDGTVKHLPFHSYTMKQAIQEGFILDVLAYYTPVNSYYKIAKTVEDDPQFDTKKAQKKLRRYVEGHSHAIQHKAEIMVDHFHKQVLAQKKIGGQARAMVVTDGVQNAINYYHAICECLAKIGSQYQAIVAFSDEHDYGGKRVSEASLNDFPSKAIVEKIRQDPYRFLICADKFQTGYDEPLLHTMYVDKTLSGIKAVQTLSRLNRACAKKHDTFVLDFKNDADTILEAFTPYYRTTILSGETDPNKLHDLQAALDNHQVYSTQQMEELARLFFGDAERDQLDPILDACVEVYNRDLDEDAQVDFKGKAKTFIRTYAFLATILPYCYERWEERAVFLNFLVPKLPAPKEEDMPADILRTIDMESYRVEVQARIKITPPDDDGEIEPVPTGGDSRRPEPELDPLSKIVNEFNNLFGDIQWDDRDRVLRQAIIKDLPEKIKANVAYRNVCQNSDDRENTRHEYKRALKDAIDELRLEFADLHQQFSDNDDFKRWISERIFDITYAELSGNNGEG